MELYWDGHSGGNNKREKEEVPKNKRSKPKKGPQYKAGFIRLRGSGGWHCVGMSMMEGGNKDT